MIGDNPELLAEIASIIAVKRCYLPIIDSPRLHRPDAQNEITRRNNGAAKVRAKKVLFADVSDEVVNSFVGRFPSKIVHRISNTDDLSSLDLPQRVGEPLIWGKENIAIGLLSALYAGKPLKLANEGQTATQLKGKGSHLVVCENENAHSQVVAACYAYSIGAGLKIIDAAPEEEAEDLLEMLYSLHSYEEFSSESPSHKFDRIKKRLLELSGAIELDGIECITFFTGSLPWGIAFPQVPSTHVFYYPDVGLQIINGLVAEQEDSTGIGVASMVDPGEVDSTDIKIASEALYPKGVVVRHFKGRDATISNISRMMEVYPFDFLMISSHCGDASGWQWTYEYKDSEGIQRKLVTHVAASFSLDTETDMVDVVTYNKFISLDGVPWNDREKKKDLYVGTAILDYVERNKEKGGMEPVKRETIPRVAGSSAIKLFDGNYLMIPNSIADEHSPIIINNACTSWHRLAGTATFAGARAYIGTLFPITDSEAMGVTKSLFKKHFGKPLSVALWRAQNENLDSSRRSYVLTGLHFQRFNITPVSKIPLLVKRLMAVLKIGILRKNSQTLSKNLKKRADENVSFLEKELQIIKNKGFKNND